MSEMRKLVVFLGCLLCFAMAGVWSGPARADVREAVVKIYTVRNRPDYPNPWNIFGPESLSCFGFLFSGRRFLTNVHGFKLTLLI